MKRATIMDVAELAGVSTKTVSRVTNCEPHVRASTRHRVIVAIEALHYQPDENARQMAFRRAGNSKGTPAAPPL